MSDDVDKPHVYGAFPLHPPPPCLPLPAPLMPKSPIDFLSSFSHRRHRQLVSHCRHPRQPTPPPIPKASHELVPPDEMLPVIKTIAHNFITDRCPEEVCNTADPQAKSSNGNTHHG